jgi:hypothetical protein
MAAGTHTLQYNPVQSIPYPSPDILPVSQAPTYSVQRVSKHLFIGSDQFGASTKTTVMLSYQHSVMAICCAWAGNVRE